MSATESIEKWVELDPVAGLKALPGRLGHSSFGTCPGNEMFQVFQSPSMLYASTMWMESLRVREWHYKYKNIIGTSSLDLIPVDKMMVD